MSDTILDLGHRTRRDIHYVRYATTLRRNRRGSRQVANQGSDKIKLRRVNLEEKDGQVYVVV